MKAFRCDRCGKHYIKNKDEWNEPLIFRVSWNYNELDLCDECLGKLQKWMDEYRKENEEE